MTEATLTRANGIKSAIDKLNYEHSRISKMFSRKDELTQEEVDDLFQIAMVNTSYAINRLKDEFKSI